ncbi:ATP-binding protein [Amycolatopsis sp. cmx-8-4]|uniref:ATP-binding protein n=1 Tax=Amycolatopsis sp. cmx-8-4 TaxID=2790947 RepID=UPI00397BF6E9
MSESNQPERIRNSVFGGAGIVLQADTVGGDVHLHGRRGLIDGPPRQLPADVRGFVGRESDLKKLDSLAAVGPDQSGTVIISALAGSPGVGKTALALHWAHRVHEQYADGQLYVNLRGYDPLRPLSPEEAIEGFLIGLGVSPEDIPRGLDALTGLYRSVLANRRVLVVLDNARDFGQILPLLPGSPSCTVIVTSRNHMSDLVARTGASRLIVDVLSPNEAEALLREIIGGGCAEEDPQDLAELVRLCGYLPLALRIAAERAATDSYSTIADLNGELTTERHRLDALTTHGDESTDIRCVFSWSYRSLAPELARTFRLLGLHPGPDVSVGAAAALIDVRLTDAKRSLEMLASAHLLERTGRDRFQFHDLLRAYAAELAEANDSPDTRDDAVRRVLDWYLRVAVNASQVVYPNRRLVQPGPQRLTDAPLAFDGRDQALDWYAAERANLLAAIQAAVVMPYDLGWKLPVVMTDLLWKQRWENVVVILDKALTIASDLGDREGEICIIENFADHALDFEEWDDATEYFSRILLAAHEIDAPYFVGWALNGLGCSPRGLDRVDAATSYLNQALESFRATANRGAEATVLANIGNVLRRQGRLADAVTWCQHSLSVCQAIGDAWREAWTERVLGMVYLDLDDVDEAMSHFVRALTINREFDNRFDSARTLTCIGDALETAGQRLEANQAWKQAAVIFEDLGAPQLKTVTTKIGHHATGSAHREQRNDQDVAIPVGGSQQNVITAPLTEAPPGEVNQELDSPTTPNPQVDD